MQTYTYYLTIEVQAMNEDSAENKIEGFLKGLDLKKNQHLNLTSFEYDDGEESDAEGEEPEAPAAATTKKERPPIRLPKGKGSAKWGDEFDDADWDELDEDKDKNPKVKAEDLEDEDEWEWEDDWDDEDDEDDDDDIGALMKGL